MQFYTQHYEEVNAELIKFEEVKSVGKGNIYPYSSPNILFKLPYCPVWQAVEERDRQRAERVKEYVDRFTRQCADEYKPSYYCKSICIKIYNSHTASKNNNNTEWVVHL